MSKRKTHASPPAIRKDARPEGIQLSIILLVLLAALVRCLFHVQSPVVVGVVHGAVLPVALGEGVSPVHPPLVQQVVADLPHN